MLPSMPTPAILVPQCKLRYSTARVENGEGLTQFCRGMAPVAHVIWNKFMRFNPKNPKWLNRDRFVLS